jgi:hypothetical protein
MFAERSTRRALDGIGLHPLGSISHAANGGVLVRFGAHHLIGGAVGFLLEAVAGLADVEFRLNVLGAKQALHGLVARHSLDCENRVDVRTLSGRFSTQGWLASAAGGLPLRHCAGVRHRRQAA